MSKKKKSRPKNARRDKAEVYIHPDDQLWEAVWAGNVAHVKSALKAGAEVNTEDEDGRIPLMSAASLGNLEMVKLLLAAGADPNRWAQGDNPLERAATGGNRDVYDLLRTIVTDDVRKAVSEEQLLKGEKRRAREADTILEPFIDAAMMGKLDQLEAGLAAKVDVDAIGPSGNAALHYASLYGRLPVVERLVAAGANVNVRTEEEGLGGAGSTPLTLVASSFFANNRPEVIRRLLDAGADINASDDSGKTALMHAVYDFTGFADSIDTLIATGADLDVVDENGNTALMLAVSREKREFVSRLCEAGASDAGVANILLLQAAGKGDADKVRKLLAEGSVNVNYKTQMTPLTTACLYGHAEVVRLLIEAGADVNLSASSKSPLTPLIRAAYGGHLEATRLLLEAGADVNAEVKGAGTALDYALRGEMEKKGETLPRKEVIHLLEAAGTPLRVMNRKQTRRK